jgi:OPA family glycerol-3-phosphate transporter-like MFS transporter
MKEKYLLDDAVSIFLTLFLPLFAVFGSTFAIFLSQKLKNYIVVCGVLYLSAVLLFVPVIIFFNQNYWLLSLACFILIACAMAGVNNVITSIFPMMQKGKINAGMIAGVMDGFCYVGSAITAYGIGSLADKFSWHTVLYLFISVCLFTVLICAIYLLITKIVSKSKAN